MDKIYKAAREFLKVKDYEILETDFYFDFICKDADGTIIFIDVCENDEEIFPREEIEQDMIGYLSKRGKICRGGLRFDTITVTLLDDNRAFIKYHVDVL